MESADSKNQTNPITIIENVVRGTVQMILIRIHGNAGSHGDTMALCDTGKSQTWFDQELLEKFNLDGEEVTNLATGNHVTSPNQSKKFEITLGPADSTAANKCNIMMNSHEKSAVWKDEYDLRPLKQRYKNLSCRVQNAIRLSEVKVILRQERDAFCLICPVAS